MYRKMKQSYHGAMAKRTRKGEQHDRNADTGASSQDASPNGSEVSVRPDGSQELSSDETAAPGGAAQNPEPVAARLGEHSHEYEDQRISEAGTAQQLTQQVLALIQENHLHAPIVLPDPKELAELRRDAPEIYALYVKAVDIQIKDESYTRRAPFEIPDRFTRRGQYLGFVSVLASLGVVAYAIYTNHPLIAGIIGALNLVALAAVFVAPDRASKGEE
jgi:hypothetical protein